MKKQVEAQIPTQHGHFRLAAYAHRRTDRLPHLALISERIDIEEPVIVRIHSECITGDLFGSIRCDCGAQLAQATQMIAEQGGVLIYLRQEGRGIGIINKLEAYNLQDRGFNTIDANLHLGFEPDQRTYDDALFILRDLGIKQVRLLTNNPLKTSALQSAGVHVVERLPLVIAPEAENLAYQTTKQELMGHLLGL
jgi:GTP cyclohydrolase II